MTKRPRVKSKPPISQRAKVLSIIPATGMSEAEGVVTLAGMVEPIWRVKEDEPAPPVIATV